MHIDEYEFGRMVIDGRTYTSDLLILIDEIRPNWRRRRGHSLYEEDLEDVLLAWPEVLVVGTGAFGRMRVPVETWEALQRVGIQSVIEKTPKAVKAFNELAREGRLVAAAFHLTC